jgi:hypothetical protein
MLYGHSLTCVISDFHHRVKEIFALPRFNAPYIGSYLLTIRDNYRPHLQGFSGPRIINLFFIKHIYPSLHYSLGLLQHIEVISGKLEMCLSLLQYVERNFPERRNGK